MSAQAESITSRFQPRKRVDIVIEDPHCLPLPDASSRYRRFIPPVLSTLSFSG